MRLINTNTKLEIFNNGASLHILKYRLVILVYIRIYPVATEMPLSPRSHFLPVEQKLPNYSDKTNIAPPFNPENFLKQELSSC